jgi:hypothetical protein
MLPGAGTLVDRLLGNRPALAALVINLLPVAGVIWLGWSGATLVVIYWLENVVLGVFTLARMLTVAVAQRGAWGLLAMAFLGPFFCFHYGIFCMVHGIFVLAIFGDGAVMQGNSFDPTDVVGLALAMVPGAKLALIGLVIWHALKFGLFFLGQGQHRRSTVTGEMGAPYARIMIVHVGIFAAGFGLAAAGDPLVGVFALVLLKAVIETWVELTPAGRPTPTAPPQSP